MKSAVTVSLVPETAGGPFVFHDGLADGCRRAAEAGFDAVELFPPSADAVDTGQLKQLLDEHGLALSAIGTGAGWVVSKLHLVSADETIRARARDFVAGIIDLAGSFGAPAILGSMQGRIDQHVQRDTALGWLREMLTELGTRSATHGVPLLYEPLNRYETNVFSRLAQAAAFFREIEVDNLMLLCDLFHMNIEEPRHDTSIQKNADKIGYVHFADSNRHAAGFGHTDFGPIARTLSEIGYNGYLSAEVLPLPDSNTAAAQTIKKLRELNLID